MRVAICTPDAVLESAELLARQLNVSRSTLCADAIASYLVNDVQDAVTKRLDSVYAASDSRLESAFIRAQAGTLRDETW